MTIVLKNRAGVPIKDWQDWTRPKQEHQWKEGRSAMELARSWFRLGTPQCPVELQSLLSTNSRLANIRFDEGYPELVTPLPQRGEGRNHDLLLRAHIHSEAGREAVLVCVEAKVDEPFGETIGEYWHKAKARQEQEHTHAPERIEALLEIVFGPTAKPNQLPWSDLHYQLLTGIAGTLIEASKEKVGLAVFVVHEFQTFSIKPNLLEANAESYSEFIKELFDIESASASHLYGPLRFEPRTHLPHTVDIFVGKAIC